MRWEPVTHRMSAHEEFADVTGVGRYLIRRLGLTRRHRLTFNGTQLHLSRDVADLKRIAEEDAQQRLKKPDEEWGAIVGHSDWDMPRVFIGNNAQQRAEDFLLSRLVGISLNDRDAALKEAVEGGKWTLDDAVIDRG